MAGDHESGGAIAAAFAANMGIAATKFVGFIITGSSSLLAESIHSVADSSNQGLLFLGGRQATRKPDELHQFGYGRVRYFWAFVVSVVLFSLGGLFSVYEGYHKIHDPHELESAGIAIGILVVAFVLEAFALRTAVRHAKPHRGNRTWTQYITQSRSPELPVLLLEDSGALIGLICALTGVLMAVITGDPIWDGIGTLAIGLVLLGIAAVLAREMRSLLIGESASPELERKIDQEIERAPEIVRVIHTLTEHIGPDEILIAAKVEFAPDLTTQQIVDAINAAEVRVRAIEGIGTARIYVEPDVGTPETVAEAAAPKPEPA
ncbi:cation diffusion facilitator family transporter [Solirubrobacter soli]|uniref:cation diffusion facilitator family transporter n=1 Tax=Solirubrobacter soli TaxID=363832 RepID=UPI0003FE57B2|nr:cation diffusion facilitator family transporter [Solirubrobacter soli]